MTQDEKKLSIIILLFFICTVIGIVLYEKSKNDIKSTIPNGQVEMTNNTNQTSN